MTAVSSAEVVKRLPASTPASKSRIATATK